MSVLELNKMTMNLNLNIITKPVIIDRDTIEGMLPESCLKVVVRRKLCGWRKFIEIVVDDVVVHSDEAMQSEQEAFYQLSTRAQMDADQRHSTKRATVSKAVKNLFA